MEVLHVGYAAAGTLAVALILGSRWIRHTPLSEPLLGLATGAVLGPALIGALHIPDGVQTTLLLETSRVLLAISLVGVGLRFPLHDLRSIVRPVLVLVAVAMPVSAAVTGALAVWTLGLPVALAALVGACLCPTDPVLASGVVTGSPAAEDLPARLRKVLTTESGVNDGLALPLVLIAMAPVLGDAVTGAVGDAAKQVGLAVLIAVPVGYAVGRAVRALDAHDDIEKPPALLLSLMLAIAVLGVARLVHSDGVLAVFVAALAYNGAVGRDERHRQDELDEAFNRYLIVPVFMVFGAVLPWDRWADLGWGGAAFAVGVLLLRRPPVVLLLRPAVRLRMRDALFTGWFGPIGVSALFYLTLAEHDGVADPRLFAAGSLAVAVSTVVHGMTTVLGRRLYHDVDTPSGHVEAPADAPV